MRNFTEKEVNEAIQAIRMQAIFEIMNEDATVKEAISSYLMNKTYVELNGDEATLKDIKRLAEAKQVAVDEFSHIETLIAQRMLKILKRYE